MKKRLGFQIFIYRVSILSGRLAISSLMLVLQECFFLQKFYKLQDDIEKLGKSLLLAYFLFFIFTLSVGKMC